MYFDLGGNIFSFLDRFWQESLLLHPIVILITLLYILNALQL